MEQDFASITPNEHLMAAAPLQGATYSIEALHPPRDVAEMLGIDAACPAWCSSAAPPRTAASPRW
jgi:GntR family histidine utilization transcriptional repressor